MSVSALQANRRFSEAAHHEAPLLAELVLQLTRADHVGPAPGDVWHCADRVWSGADTVWPDADAVGPAAIGLIPILSARDSTSSSFHHNEYDCLKAILYNCVRHGPASQNRDGRPDFRGHLLGRVAHVTLLNPSRGGRLRAQFEQIRWDQE